MHRVLREPLLHFVILGALLFAAFAIVNRDNGNPDGRIVVSAAQVENIATQFARVRQRPPTREELAKLIENHVREEVLYREGIAMGLDRDDEIIRRRVRQKIEFLAESAASPEPTEAQLQAYLAANPDKFVSESRVSFVQIYVNPELHADVETHVGTLLQRMRRPADEGSFEQLGDQSLLAREVVDARESEVSATFGEMFAKDLARVVPGSWQGPIRSPYGLHLVLVTHRVERSVPRLTDVRDAVAREWTREQLSNETEAFYEELRGRYTVTVEASAAAVPSHAGSKAP